MTGTVVAPGAGTVERHLERLHARHVVDSRRHINHLDGIGPMFKMVCLWFAGTGSVPRFHREPGHLLWDSEANEYHPPRAGSHKPKSPPQSVVGTMLMTLGAPCAC